MYMHPGQTRGFCIYAGTRLHHILNYCKMGEKNFLLIFHLLISTIY